MTKMPIQITTEEFETSSTSPNDEYTSPHSYAQNHNLSTSGASMAHNGNNSAATEKLVLVSFSSDELYVPTDSLMSLTTGILEEITTSDNPSPFSPLLRLENNTLSGTHMLPATINIMQQAEIVFGVLSLIISILGTIGNILSIIVMSQKSFKAMPISKVIRFLGFCDSIYLLLSLNQHDWFIKLINVDIRSFSNLSCKLFLWSSKTSATVSIWMLIIITVYRFITMMFSNPSPYLVFTTQKIYIAIASIAIAIGSLHLGICHYSDGLVQGVCTINANKDKLTAVLMAILVCIYTVIPTLVLVILNAAIVIKLCLRKTSKAITSSVHVPGISAMLGAVVIAYLILTAPLALCHTIALKMGEDLYTTHQVRLFIAGKLAQVLSKTNCAVNFYIYVILCRNFRKEIKQMFNCSKHSALIHPMALQLPQRGQRDAHANI